MVKDSPQQQYGKFFIKREEVHILMRSFLFGCKGNLQHIAAINEAIMYSGIYFVNTIIDGAERVNE